MKIGKTTFGASMPKSLLLAFEIGYKEIPGVIAQDMTSWADMKRVVAQLSSPQAREKYDTIIIDTVDIAYELCSKHVAMQKDVLSIGDVPYGAGWGMLAKEFTDTFSALGFMGYGVLFIAHEKEIIEKSEERGEIRFIKPNLPPHLAKMLNKMVDIIAYAGLEEQRDGKFERVLITRGTPQIEAGGRNPHFPPKVPFGYDHLVEALTQAVEKQKEEGAITVDKIVKIERKEVSFEDVRAEAHQLWQSLLAQDADNGVKVMDITRKHFGHPKKLSEIEPFQQELFELIVDEMRELVKRN